MEEFLRFEICKSGFMLRGQRQLEKQQKEWIIGEEASG